MRLKKCWKVKDCRKAMEAEALEVSFCGLVASSASATRVSSALTAAVYLAFPNHYKIIHHIAVANIKIGNALNFKAMFEIKINGFKILTVNR